MSIGTTFAYQNPPRIVQIIPAEHGWYAHFKDSERIPIICWALVDNGGVGTVIGLAAPPNSETLAPASTLAPNFVEYIQRIFNPS